MSMYASETESNYAQNGKLVLASTILFFILLLFFIFLRTFRHTCFRRRRNNHHHIRHHAPTNSTTFAFNKGLHPSFLASLPTFTHSSSYATTSSDNCAVCMSEFAAGDEGRVLPSCRHVFHSHCIDAWFRFHSNCPLCRTAVQHGPTDAQPAIDGSDHVELGLASWSSFPGPVWCPRKPLELEEDKLRKSYCINITLTPHV